MVPTRNEFHTKDIPIEREREERVAEREMSGGAMSSVVANGGGQSHSPHKVFVYGSLMAEDVCRVLLNRVPQSSPAILNG